MHYRFPDVEDFADMLLDLCSGVAPALVVCDGVQAMMGDGPSSGVRCDMGYTLVSRSPYALDIALCNLMGFDTGRVPTVKQSIKRDMVFPKIEVVGDDLIPVQNFLQPQSKGIDFTNFVPRFLRRPARNFMRAVLTPRPVVNRDMCVGCGKCAESCPQKTIEIVQKKAVIHYNKCQKCYCCHEMCPIHAIDVRKNIITKR